MVVRAAVVSTNDFKTGLTVEIDGTPYKVIGKLPLQMTYPYVLLNDQMTTL